MLLIIDNYDSFTYNLFQYLAEIYPGDVVVRKNDEVTVEEALSASHIVISPGPGHPARSGDFGRCAEIISQCRFIPTLGVCLGHQGIGHIFGAEVTHAPYVMHGMTSVITHSGRGLFQDIPQGIKVARYHSLCVENPPEDMEVTAVSEDGLIMAIEHRSYPIYGVQFHPESVLTEHGKTILKNFVSISPEKRNIPSKQGS